MGGRILQKVAGLVCCMNISIFILFQFAVHSFQSFCETRAALPLSYNQPITPFIQKVDKLTRPSMSMDSKLYKNSQRGILSPSIKKHVPDGLSFARLLAIPFFIASFVQGQKHMCATIFGVSCFTDFLDGYLARKWEITSSFGAFIDPVADKVSVAVALVMLVVSIPDWFFVVGVACAISREILVSALREWMAERQQRATVKVGFLGKAKTALQMVSVVSLLYTTVGLNKNRNEIAMNPMCADFDSMHSSKCSPLFTSAIIMFFMSVALSIISAGQYLFAAWPLLIGNDAVITGDRKAPS